MQPRRRLCGNMSDVLCPVRAVRTWTTLILGVDCVAWDDVSLSRNDDVCKNRRCLQRRCQHDDTLDAPSFRRSDTTSHLRCADRRTCSPLAISTPNPVEIRIQVDRIAVITQDQMQSE